MEAGVDAENRKLVETLYFERGRPIEYVVDLSCLPEKDVLDIIEVDIRKGVERGEGREPLTPQQRRRVLNHWDNGTRDMERLVRASAYGSESQVREYLRDLALAGIIEIEPQYMEQHFSGEVGGKQYLNVQRGGGEITLPAALETGAEKPETEGGDVIPQQYLNPAGNSYPYVSTETEGYQYSGPVLVSLPQASRKWIKLSKGEIDTAVLLRGEGWMLVDIARFLGRSLNSVASHLKKAYIKPSTVIGVAETGQEGLKRVSTLALYFGRGATDIKYISGIVGRNTTVVGTWIREELGSGRRPSMHRRWNTKLLSGREKRRAIELLEQGVKDPVEIGRAVGVHRRRVEALVEDLRIAGRYYEIEKEPERQKNGTETAPAAPEQKAPPSAKRTRKTKDYLGAAVLKNRNGTSPHVSTPPPKGFPLEYRVVTLQDMTEALKRERNMGEEDAEKTAETVLNFFGFQDCIVDNALTVSERDLFYALQGEGEEKALLATEEEATSRGGGKGWAIKYWRLNKAMIFREIPEERVVPEEEAVYQNINRDVFAGHAKRSKAASS